MSKTAALKYATISQIDSAQNNTLRLDMTPLGGRGFLKRPLCGLVKVLLHRTGLVYAVQGTADGYVVEYKKRGGRTVRPATRTGLNSRNFGAMTRKLATFR